MSSRGRLRTPSLKARFLTEDDLEVMYDDSDADLDKVSTDNEDERMAADDNKKVNGMEAETCTSFMLLNVMCVSFVRLSSLIPHFPLLSTGINTIATDVKNPPLICLDVGTNPYPHQPVAVSSSSETKAAKLESGLYKELSSGRLVKLCSGEGCTSVARKGGVCMKHGAVVPVAVHISSSSETKAAKLESGLYKELSSGRLVILCSGEGCTSVARKGGVCMKHGAVVTIKTCKHEGCTSIAQKGGVCVKHGAKLTPCSHEGCTSNAQKGGVCVKHGAKLTPCSHEGCNSKAQKGGVCVKHGAIVKTCCYEGCTKKAKKGGVCMRHARKNDHMACSVEAA